MSGSNSTDTRTQAEKKKSDDLLQQFKTHPDMVPNFHSTYSVTLPHPIQLTFEKLGRGSTLEASVRLSDLCKNFKIVGDDKVVLGPASASDNSSSSPHPSLPSLLKSTCRSLPSVDTDTNNNAPTTDILPRTFFYLVESVTILGPIKTEAHIVGCLTSDERNYEALYESYAGASGGVYIRKTRKFSETELDGGAGTGTLVHEVIEGKCGDWLRGIVEKETKRAHK